MLVRAAVKVHIFEDGRDLIIPVHRHCDAQTILEIFGVKAWRRDMEGFLTDTGEFLDRCEAFDHAAACGQIDADDPEGDFMFQDGVLFSEDLW